MIRSTPRTRSIALALLALTGCQFDTGADKSAVVAVPESYSWAAPSNIEVDVENRWWHAFEDRELDALLERVLVGNLDLAQAWTRLRQARATARAARAPDFPTLDLNGTASKREIDAGGSLGILSSDRYSLGLSLSYELDLFGRIDATADAAALDTVATRADVEATALTLAASTVSNWIAGIENRALVELVEEQIEVGEQLLLVTEMRFANGNGTALDVLQQRRQLEGTKSELPRFKRELELTKHSLALLAGVTPADAKQLAIPTEFPLLGELPALDVPSALLERRPDVVAARVRLESVDRSLAAAIAARFPRLVLNPSASFESAEASELFESTVITLLANLTAPLLDGKSRRSEVERQRALLDEAVFAFSAAFLGALHEVEDALAVESHQSERVEILGQEVEFARAELTRARQRYVNGVDSYLQVLAAVQTLQALERNLISERATLLANRSELHRALGGAWTRELEAPDA